LKRLKVMAALFAAGLLAFAGLWFVHWTEAGVTSQPVPVVIPQGASVARAAQVLEEAGVLEDADGFRRRARLLGGDKPIRAGEYEVPAGASEADVLALLRAAACCSVS
jgi:UPF0755 protein